MDVLIDPYGNGTPVLVVSNPYPLVETDEASLAADLVGGQLFSLLPIENVDVTGDLVSGVLTLTVNYVTRTQPAEGADLSADFTSGVLTLAANYLTSTIAAEGADLAADLLSGSLVYAAGYLTYGNPADGADLAADFIEGILA